MSQKVWQDSGKKRGYGYVEFDDEDPVDKIVLLRIHNVGDSRYCCQLHPALSTHFITDFISLRTADWNARRV